MSVECLFCDLHFMFCIKSIVKCCASRDTYCYACGKYTLKSQRKAISPRIKKAEFMCKVGDQDKSWAPQICCSAANLLTWLNGSRPSVPFAIPVIWYEQKDYFTDCYFCLRNVSGFIAKNKKAIQYPNLPSLTQPVMPYVSLPVPRWPAMWTLDDDKRLYCWRIRASHGCWMWQWKWPQDFQPAGRC